MMQIQKYMKDEWQVCGLMGRWEMANTFYVTVNTSHKSQLRSNKFYTILKLCSYLIGLPFPICPSNHTPAIHLSCTSGFASLETSAKSG
jgi:hypothetical protein